MDVPDRQIRSQSNRRICLSSNRGILPEVVSPSEAKESPAEVVIPSEAEESLYLLAPAKMPAQRWPKSTRPLPMTPYCGTVIRQRSGGTPSRSSQKTATRRVISTEAADSSIVRCAAEKSASQPIPPDRRHATKTLSRHKQDQIIQNEQYTTADQLRPIR